MRLLYRLLPPPSHGQEQRPGRRARPSPTPVRAGGAGAAGAAVDVVVDVEPDATVGQVADLLAGRWFPDAAPPATGWTVRPAAAPAPGAPASGAATAPDRDAPAASALPRSGTTVRLSAARPDATDRHVPSPVVVAGPHGPTRLPYGTTALSHRGAGVDIEVGRAVRLLAVDARTVTVDGVPLRGATTVAPGAVVELGGAPHVIRFDGPLHPPPPGGPLAAVLPLRPRCAPVPAATVELPTAPPPARAPAWPVISAAVPLLMGAALWWATHSLATVGFVLFSFAFVLAAAAESRREARAERRFREREFASDLAEASDRLAAMRDAELARHRTAAPSSEHLAGAAATAQPPWDRTPGQAAAATVRVGTGDLPPASSVVLHDGGRRDLRERARAVAAGHVLRGAPVTVDLAATGGLAVAGPGEQATAVARAVVVQLASRLPPGGWSVELRCAAGRRAAWRWLAWLPQYGAGGAPRLVVVDATDPPEPAPDPAADDGSWWLWVGAQAAGLPATVGAVLDLAGGSHGGGGPVAAEAPDALRPDLLHLPGAAPVPCRAEGLTEDEAEVAARGLCGLRPGGPGADGTGSPVADGRPLRLGALLCGAADPDRVLRRWHEEASGLAAPLGRSAGGTLWLDLERDGPHGLVAGTTGSGKSEALRTLVAGLALHHGPERVNLLLVDYKGGAAFGPLVDLPHTVGVVTDLRPTLARRALTSLRAEVLRREEVLRRHGAPDVPTLRRRAPADCPPSLVVVVDEFATLAQDLPDVLEGLVDLSRRGRSLGIHLVLATQRPAGVVSAEIRANTSFRLALRVADPEDSVDVVDVPDAARLPRDRPGAGLLRLGAGPPVPLRVAWTGAPRPDRRPVRSSGAERVLLAGAGVPVEASGPGGAGDGGTGSEADAVVAAVRTAHRRTGGRPAPAPWLPPLPERLDPEQLPRPAAGTTGAAVAVGVVDLPERQRQEPWRVDLPGAGGLLVLGAVGSGTAGALRAMGRSFLDGGAGRRVVGIDGGSSDLPPGSGVGPVVAAEDAEAVLRLVRALDDEVRQRTARPRGDAAPLLALVHDVGRLEAAHDRVNRGEAVAILCRLAADGPAAGVHLAVSARHRAEVTPLLLPRLGHRVALRMASAEEASVLGAPAELADRDLPAGRGVVLAGPSAGAWVQLAGPPRPDGSAPPGGAGVVPADVPRLPGRLLLSDLTAGGATDAGDGSTAVAVGLDGNRWRLDRHGLGVARLDLAAGHALVVGPARSGRSTALDVVARSAAVGGHWQHRVLVTWGVRRRGADPAWTAVVDLDEPVTSDDPPDVASVLAALVPTVAAPTVVAVDDLTELLDGPTGPTVEAWLCELLARGRREPVRLVAAADADSLAHTFSEPVRRLRSARRGLLLRPDPDLHPPLLHCSLPPHDELPPAPGRGWLVDDEGPRPVQVALPG